MHTGKRVSYLRAELTTAFKIPFRILQIRKTRLGTLGLGHQQKFDNIAVEQKRPRLLKVKLEAAPNNFFGWHII